MSANPELWKQIVADRAQNIEQDARIRHLLAERDMTSSRRMSRIPASARTWLGHQLVAAGERVQGLEVGTLALTTSQPCGDPAR